MFCARLPGIVLEAHIITGEKSLFQYLLKPVYRSLETAFSNDRAAAPEPGAALDSLLGCAIEQSIE